VGAGTGDEVADLLAVEQGGHLAEQLRGGVEDV
jgi:hypothetical protein